MRQDGEMCPAESFVKLRDEFDKKEGLKDSKMLAAGAILHAWHAYLG